MIKKLLREFYLLPRGEQRALVAVTFLLMVSLLVRMGVQVMPERKPAGIEAFEREAKAILMAIALADSVEQVREDSLNRIRSFANPRRTFDGRNAASVQPYQPVDINRADSAQLLPLYGIGPVFAGRIIRYRDLLGGFVSADQLEEVYGLPAETVDRIRSRIRIDSSAVRKIHLDSASFGELLRHPYLDYEQVKALVAYRDFAGKIHALSELRDNHVLADTSLAKLSMYFDF